MARGRKNMGKTKTIKDRRLAIYVPDLETVDRWKATAASENTSLSGFVNRVVEEYIGKKSAPSSEKLKELESGLNSLEEECQRLRGRETDLLSQIEILHQELQLCRSQLFENMDFNPSEISKRLIDLLRDGKTAEDILVEMKAVGNPKLRNIIAKQIELLFEFGLIEFDGRKWRTVG